MKKNIRKVLSLLLGVVLLMSVLPSAMASEDNTLYNWTASAEEKDKKALASNLVANAEAKTRWNESATIYTDKGAEQVILHTFLNESAVRGNTAYGLPVNADTGLPDTLKVDVFPLVDPSAFKAVGVSFVYAYKAAEKGLNLADSNLLRVYVSGDGMNWSEEYVGMRSAKMLGTGTTKSGEQIVCYEICTEDVAKLAGKMIWGLRIMPDGVDGANKGTFSVSEVTITGYKSKADFEAAVPAKVDQATGTGKADPELCRQVILETARNSAATSDMGVLADALALIGVSVPSTPVELLTSAQIRPMDGVDTVAKDSVLALFGYMYERHEMTPEREAQILAEYLAIKTSDDIVRDLNTPQSIMRAYGKAKTGDLLVVANERGDSAYMVVKSEPVYLVDQLTVDPLESKITYLTRKGEKSITFYDAYRTVGYLPMAVVALASGVVALPTVDVHVAMVDKTRVSVVSNQIIDDCTIALGGTTITKNNINSKLVICDDAQLTSAVAALTNGKYELAVTVTDYLSNSATKTVTIEVKDGKATAQAAAADHSAACPSKAMTDVDKNAWYHTAVDYALTNGIMGGYNATTFGPNDTLSRAMVVQVLYNKEGQPAISGKHDFTDVPADQWFNNAVTWGTKNGVMGGYGNGKFGPNDSVTIEQIAVILWNYAGNPAFTGKADGVGAYSGWAANALAWAVENDILEGVPFKNATENATRAQTAQMLMNYLKNN